MFFTMSQNNSGGYFVEDDDAGVCEYVIIEADSAKDAAEKLDKIGDSVDGFHNFCPCCGERWSAEWLNDDDGDEQPSIYGEPIEKCKKERFRDRCFTHYKDGRVVETVFAA